MKAIIYNTVKTETAAVKILHEEVGAVRFGVNTGMCECGQTTVIVGMDRFRNTVGKIAICSSCGDDDAFVDEVLIKN